jgi:hypothetical protein
MTARKPSTIAGLRRGIGTSKITENVDVINESDDLGRRAPDQRPRKEKPVRFTLDLDRDRHRFLKQHAVSLDADASQVLRALLDELRDDPALAGRVRDRIWPWTQ